MAIDLDAHNLEAYMAVKDMLCSKGRPVMIPTLPESVNLSSDLFRRQDENYLRRMNL